MKAFLILLTGILWTALAYSQQGKQGDVIVNNVNTYLNDYTYLTQNATAGDMMLHIANNGFNTNNMNYPLEAGDLLLVIQMQGAELQGNVNDISWGAVIDYHNCGNYEFIEVLGVPNPSQIDLACPVQNDYSAQGRTQVVRVPRINNLTINNGGEVTCQPWNGQFGGVVALEVLGNTIINAGGSIDATGFGFRGGQMDNQSNYGAVNYAYQQQNRGGEKGESIGGYQNDYTALGGRYGRGAPANGGGGGNTHNAGGGGGANAGAIENWNGLGNPDNTDPNWALAWDLEYIGFSGNISSGGGRGGYTFSFSNQDALTLPPNSPQWNGDDRRNVGGIGGRPLNYGMGRIFLGGGGGAGDGNNGAGTDGANGGGIVLLQNYGTISGAGIIRSNGQNAPMTPPNGNDAPGGGGGGGTVILNSIGLISGISIEANGGQGGDQNINSNEAEGPGGGGGGGYIAISNGTPITSVLGGANGTTNSNALTEFIPNGATAGGDGQVANVIINNQISIVTADDDSICSGESTTLTATLNPVQPGEFYWYDAAIGGNILGTGPTFTTPILTTTTTYYVGHCPGTYRDTVTVFVSPDPQISIFGQDALCNGSNDGMAWVNVNDVTSFYSIQWNTGATTDSISGLNSGTYSVVVTNAVGCSDSADIIINKPAPITAQYNLIHDATCIPGQAYVSVQGGVGAYSYLWTPTGNTDSLANNLTAGYYSITVTDSNGCEHIVQGVVAQMDSLVLGLTATNNLCFGGSSGSVIANATGGSQPYVYDFGTGFSANYIDSNLTAGNYMVTVQDSLGCTATENINITEPSQLTSDLQFITPANCGVANGSASLLVAGGTAPYQADWPALGSNTFFPSNLASGSYIVNITDQNGCNLTDTLVIPFVPTPALNLVYNDPTCFQSNDGDASINIVGGAAPFVINWSNGQNNVTAINGVGQGLYGVTITDSLGCVISENFALVDPNPIVVTTSSDSSYCGLSNGNAIISSLNGGTGALTINWAFNGSNNDTLFAVPSGTYDFDITDANGCTETFSAIVNDIGMPDLDIAHTDVSCFGGNNGTANLFINGGAAPFNFQWTQGQTVQNPTDLIAGTHFVTVTDVNGCVFSESVTIIQPDTITLTGTLVHPTCSYTADGQITLNVQGGVPGYNFNWTVSPLNSNTVSGLTGGNFAVTITDQNGCSYNHVSTLVAPDMIQVAGTTLDVTCNGLTNGSILANVSGGTTPYLYDWSNNTSNSYYNPNIGAGNYTLTITDGNGCIHNENYVINEPAPIQITPINVSNVLCFGDANGSAEVLIAGGVAPYNVNWSNGTNGTQINNVSAGLYNVIVSDDHNCQEVLGVQISQPNPLAGGVGFAYPEICGNQNGTASVTHTGGVSPYTYQWLPIGSTSPVVANMSQGNYQSVVTDGNGCVDTVDVVVGHIDGPAGTIIQQNNVSCFGGDDGSAQVISTAGTYPFNYLWIETGVFGATNNQLYAGTHHVLISDQNGCLDTLPVVVNENPQLVASNIQATIPNCSYSSDGSIVINMEGGIMPYSYSWDNMPGISNNVAFNLLGGTYQVTITDAMGCTLDTTIAIMAPGAIVSYALVDQNVWCNGGNNGQATAFATGGTGNLNYVWNSIPVQNNATATNLTAGTYTVYVSDANGCSDTSQIQIIENDPISIELAGDTTVCPNTSLLLESIVYGGSGIGYQYAWMHDGQQVGNQPWLNVVVDTTGFYELSITDNLGCTGTTDSIWIHTIEFNAGDISLIGTTDTLCEGGMASVELISNYNGNLNIVWEPNLGAGNGAFNFPVYYDTMVVVSATNECNETHWDTLDIWVWENPEISITASANDMCPPMNSVLTFDLDNNDWAVQSVYWNVGDQYSSDLLTYPIQIQSSGSYYVDLVITLTNGCVVTYDDTFSLNALSSPISSFLVNPQNATDADMVYFYDNSINATSWNWYFGNEGYSDLEDPIVHFDEPDSIQVMQVVFNDIGCSDTSWQWVIIKPTFNVFIPNAFTPDGDDYNNWFFPVITNASPEDYSFLIFNRWGELIYEGNHLEAKWDGRYQGKLVQDGVYVYKVMVRDLNNEKHEFYGHVSVLR